MRVLSRRAPEDVGLPNSVNWYRGDLSMRAELLAFVASADVLYHCAGEIRNAHLMESLHVEGTKRLLDVATGRIRRWVQLSSIGVYGQVQNGVVTEQNPHRPVGMYETTKKLSDDLVEIAGKGGAFEWTILRPSIVFGEGMPNQSLFQMIKVIDHGQFFFIGKLGASANYIYVDNVIHALSCCALLPQAAGKVFNLSDYATLEIFVSMISNELNKNVPRARVPKWIARTISRIGPLLFQRFPLTESRVEALTGRSICSIDHIQKELGYQHEVSMKEGISRLVRSWKVAGQTGQQ